MEYYLLPYFLLYLQVIEIYFRKIIILNYNK
jgi:hypothetical protein